MHRAPDDTRHPQLRCQLVAARHCSRAMAVCAMLYQLATRLALVCGLSLSVCSGAPLDAHPDASELLQADQDATSWALPAKSYEGNRYTGLTQIGRANVHQLVPVWDTQILDDGQQEAAPIIWNGVMYVSTAHDGVLALDAATGKLVWQYPYDLKYVIDFAVNRGVGLADGTIFIATQDCQLVALNAQTGALRWSVPACRDTSNSYYSMATYVYDGQIIVGHGGGDFGTQGHVTAFSAKNGQRVWEWSTIKPDTWPGTSWEHGGAAVWSGLSINPRTKTLFVGPGNAGPDMVLEGREGADLYTNSLVALDVSKVEPTVRWYYQLSQNDTHDADAAMIPVLFEGKVGGAKRALVAFGDKAGTLVFLDQNTGELLHRLAVSNQTGVFTSVPTVEGSYACPNHGGGIEWLGGAYDPDTNTFFIPSTEECGIWKKDPEPPQYVAGQAFKGGSLPKRGNGTGWLSAVDVDTGRIKWRKALPYPGQGGALVTRTGVVFTTDLGGTIYSFDTASGEELWHHDTGSSITAPISAYAVGGREYIALVVGEAGNQQTANLPAPHGSHVIAYALGPAEEALNGTTGQVPRPVAAAARQSTAAPIEAPYTSAQVERGRAVYGQSCAVCHGSQLQGVSAPALTGTALERVHVNLMQFQTTVTQQMPLTAPGSLPPQDYAAVIAYILAYDCVKPAAGGAVPYPSAPLPEFKDLVIGGATCPQEGHE